MGFFESLLSGVHDVASWLHNNSGTIETVVNTVARVAEGALLGNEKDGQTSDQSPLQMPQFVDMLSKASSVIEQDSEKQTLTLKSATPGFDPSSASSTTTIRTFSGLWTEPATLNAQGCPPSSMTRDVSQMLAMCQFPQVMPVGRDGEMINVADSIASAIFANGPKNPLLTASDEKPFTTTTFEFPSTKGDMVIKGAHSYYEIPLGSSASNSAWYGVVHMNATVDSDVSDALRAQNLAASKVTPRVVKTGTPSKTPVGVVLIDVWVVSLEITWPNGEVATTVGPLVSNALLNSNDISSLESNTMVGAIQRIRVYGNFQIKPGNIREAVQNVVGDLLREMRVEALVDVDVVGTTIAKWNEQPAPQIGPKRMD